jgi:hypothetical protein
MIFFLRGLTQILLAKHNQNNRYPILTTYFKTSVCGRHKIRTTWFSPKYGIFI